MVGVAGATGALGKEILLVLDKAPWRPEKLVALASNRSTIPFVEYGSSSLTVEDLAEHDFADLDVLILAVPTEVAKEAAERAIGEGVAVVDCSGAFSEDPDERMVVPWVNPESVKDLPARGLLAIPGAPALLLGSVLGPLWRAGIRGAVSATVLVSASHSGRDGVEELSKQVVALFNSGTPPRKVFDQGLAFDLIPQVGNADQGWTDQERRAAAEVAILVPEVEQIAVTMVGVPLFSSISATVQVRLEGSASLERIAQLLEMGGVQVPKPGPRQIPRPRRVEGHPFVHVGRLRLDEQGNLHLWATLDNLRGSAAAAVGCAGVLVKARTSSDDSLSR